jgi:hypothetical protein
MSPFDTPLLGLACRIFLGAAYADGLACAPAAVVRYADLPAEGAPEGAPEAWCETDGVYHPLPQGGFTLRLGSTAYPHLKLRVHKLETPQGSLALYAVDTHDSFSSETSQAPAGHPDAMAWQALQETNRALKEKIEAAWEAAGLLTLNGLLRQALTTDSDTSESPTAVRN